MMSADGADVIWRQWLQTTERSSVTIGFPPARQGRSGLDMEAQREAVKTYLNGGNWHIVEEFTEVESGKNSDRPAGQGAACCAASPPQKVVNMRRLDPRAARPKERPWCPVGGAGVV
jgi:Resolvase, N terminal domain